MIYLVYHERVGIYMFLHIVSDFLSIYICSLLNVINVDSTVDSRLVGTSHNI